MVATVEVCRVSIQSATEDADLALPAHIPLRKLLPSVIHLIGEQPVAGAEVHLVRPHGEVLDPVRSLAQCGVHDGELLFLTSGVRRAPQPRFDACTAVAAVVEQAAVGWVPGARRKAALVAVMWSACAVAALLGGAVLDGQAPRDVGAGAAAAVLALTGALLHRRRHRAAIATLLGVLAAAFAGLTALSTVPGPPGLPAVLLAMSGIAAMSLVSCRLLGCATAVFVPISGVAMAAAAVTAGATAGWWPASAVGPILATSALAVLGVAPRLATRSSGLSPSRPADNLAHRVERGRRTLTAVVASAAGGAAFGAVMTAALASRPTSAACFIIMVGTTLLLRTRTHTEPYAAAVLSISAGVAGTAVVGLSRAAAPWTTPWMCGALMVVVAAALPPSALRTAIPPAARRAIRALDIAVTAAVVPLACATAGVFTAIRGLL